MSYTFQSTAVLNNTLNRALGTWFAMTQPAVVLLQFRSIADHYKLSNLLMQLAEKAVGNESRYVLLVGVCV